MITYIRGNLQYAGKPIYKGFASAWEHIGHEVRYYDDLARVENFPSEYEIMMDDTQIGSMTTNQIVDTHAFPAALAKLLKAIKNSVKTYCFTQPTIFPLPWGSHPNFVSSLSKQDNIRSILNNSGHIKTWTWVDQTEASRQEYYKDWKEIHTIPLAFDHLSYNRGASHSGLSPDYDLCYVGGWANNGFDEKRRIMVEHFRALSKTNLKCGIFINKNISVEKEAAVLYNSKVALNIHDEYQRVLGLDSNERTFKSLGLTGALVCDNIGQVNRLFPDLPLYDSPEQMVEQIMNLIDDTKKLTEQKEYYRNLLLKEHTYVHRVEQMRDL
tara:strand:+ start:370 stop:1347 length:978 start_codon:yes stop_codon:yes gene_type:complete